ncbi:MAG: hypothetical protein JXJ17_15570 [Anaerolineae bacterium]|nr:hypothetical protein [Anaerolineae bacterium]
MERTVPRTDSDEIDLYIRTYYSLLRSSGEVAIETLVESHEGMDSLLHPHAREATLDVAALIYTSLRLPSCITSVQLVLLGQRPNVFERWGYPVAEWQEVSSQARRRRAYYDGKETLALIIASRSDIDDIIPVLTAFQIEWNKLHRWLNMSQNRQFLVQLTEDDVLTEDELAALGAAVGVGLDDIERLYAAWGSSMVPMLRSAAASRKRFSVRLLAGSLADYRKAMQHWWLNVKSHTPTVPYEQKRVYFVSSNTHSLVNLWSGFALKQREQLIDYIESAGHSGLLAEYREIEADAVPSSRENFFYYAMKKYLRDNPEDKALRSEEEERVGIEQAPSELGFDLDAQIIHLDKVSPEQIDPRLCLPEIERLRDSEALIFNIDYPLGITAYEVLTRISENVGQIAGVYVMGKSATLNGRVGDILIPSVVHDEHSLNTYLFNNCLTAQDVAPYLIYGTVLDNQKAVSVRGTFLQNAQYMGVFYREGYTDIEMEAGPYLSAAYELVRPTRHPQDEIVSLHGATFDIGIAHYASDKPLSKGKNLGGGSLSYRGVDPTYAASVAILRRIIKKEIEWVRSNTD